MPVYSLSDILPFDSCEKNVKNKKKNIGCSEIALPNLQLSKIDNKNFLTKLFLGAKKVN